MQPVAPLLLLQLALAIAHGAISIVAIRVQLVKYVVHMLNCIVYLAADAQQLSRHCIPGCFIRVGSHHSGGQVTCTIISRHRDPHRFGGKHPLWLRSLSSNPQRNPGHRHEETIADGRFGSILSIMASPQLWTAITESLLSGLAGLTSNT